jgi:hypothetical protein
LNLLYIIFIYNREKNNEIRKNKNI